MLVDTISGEQKLLALIAHLSYLLGGLGFIIAPLVILMLKKDDLFVYHHARQALVAHLSILIASLAVGLLCMLVIGLILVPVIIVLWLLLLITSVIAAIKTSEGQLYNYPFIQGLIGKLT